MRPPRFCVVQDIAHLQHTQERLFSQVVLGHFCILKKGGFLLQTDRFFGLLLLVVMLLLHACASAPSAQTPTAAPVAQATGVPATAAPAPGAPTVTVKNFEFGPQEIKVKVGTTVTWRNTAENPHSATAVDQSFNTRSIQPGASKSVTFNMPGTFPYYCTFHGIPDGKGGMVGTVVVEP